MAGLNETPSSERLKIAFFGLRNAGKSTLVNAFTGQSAAIVSDVPGTTTDPVSKAMEIAPLGPCTIVDTAGLDDDSGELGAMRVKRSLEVLATADIAVWVDAGLGEDSRFYEKFLSECRARGTVVLEYKRGDSVEELKRKISALRLVADEPRLLDGLVKKGDKIICVCPIDASAPKGRLILPQVQLIRECLDLHATCLVCQVEELDEVLAHQEEGTLVVTDSQAFRRVSSVLRAFKGGRMRLTSFSVLFARRQGVLDLCREGLSKLRALEDGDLVAIAEGCSHHRQCNDIGSVQIPAALKALTGKNLEFSFSSGKGFSLFSGDRKAALAVHCGGCMLTRRETLRRFEICRSEGVPVVNYGMLLAAAGGLGDVNSQALVSY